MESSSIPGDDAMTIMTCDFQKGDEIEVFYQMPFAQDHGNERIDVVGDRWILSVTPSLGSNRPRLGWTQRWLPAVAKELQYGGSSVESVRYQWQLQHWYDWATGEHISVTKDPHALMAESGIQHVRKRTKDAWKVPSRVPWTSNHLYPKCTEAGVGGCEVAVSFIVFQWGAAKIPIDYDAHSWGEREGSTISNCFIRSFFRDSVLPKVGCDYEVLTLFIQQSDEFAKISPEFLLSLCRGRTICALYFLWPIQGLQSYGELQPTAAAYVEADLLFPLVQRMESSGIPTRWPHPLQLWKLLTSKEWMAQLCICEQFQIPLTTCISKGLVLRDPTKAAQMALETLSILKKDRNLDGKMSEVVAKLGYSYEGVDVKMVDGNQLAEALYFLLTQPNYTNGSVYVQERIQVSCEARCFLINGCIQQMLYTRFGRIDAQGYVREYEKESSGDRAKRDWFSDDNEAWGDAMQQIQRFSDRWNLWLLAQSAERTVSVRIDYLLERVSPGKARVWTGEVGELGYSTSGLDPVLLFDAVVDSLW